MDSDDGLKKVQIKATNRLSRGGRYYVKLVRNLYDSEAASNAHGRYRKQAYSPDEIDLFFITTGRGEIYLIPVELIAGRTEVVLDNKYAACRV